MSLPWIHQLIEERPKERKPVTEDMHNESQNRMGANIENPSPDNKWVLSAMSGGIDSAVCTKLLIDEGYKVTGITMKLLDSDSTVQDIEDAKKICEDLGIEHITLDLRDDFEKNVIDGFCRSYSNGLTPNPCVDCNKHLKFKALHEYRESIGADLLATGHYARIAFDDDARRWSLLKGADTNKDQSYFLYNLGQYELAQTLFPLGSMEKADVKRIAEEHGLIQGNRRESQDICFVPDGDYVSFIKGNPRFMAEKIEPGKIVDMDGKELGEHSGLVNYTIGQRKGIGIAYEEPLYVYDKDVENNTLIVAPHAELMVTEIVLDNINIISGEGYEGDFATPLDVEIKLSYRQKPIPATIQLGSFEEDPNEISKGRPIKASIKLKTPHVKPAPGQSGVAYTGETVLLGGTITNS